MDAPGSNAPNQTANVRSYFERAALDFDSLYSEKRQSAFGRWVNQRFRRDIFVRHLLTLRLAQELKADSVLDVGCGSGRYLDALHRSGVHRLVGIDLSQPMLDLAAQATADAAEVRIDLHCADFMDWETDETFDLVIGMGLYDYVVDPEPMLRRMRALSRAAVAVSFPSRHWFRTPLRRVRYAIKRCPVYFYQPDQIRGIGDRAGFRETEITKIPGAGMDYFVVFRV